MTIIVELIGGPGCGKSTTAAGLFHLLKLQGKSVELISEWVKKWAWEEREIKPTDQLYITAKQMQKETDLIGKVDYIITDSPIYLAEYYGNKYSVFDMGPIVDQYILHTKNDGVKRHTFFLERSKPYDTKGRWTSEADAILADEELKLLLNQKNLSFTNIGGDDNNKPSKILEELKCTYK